MQNTGKEPLILGGVHNGRFAEYTLVLQPLECAEISAERLACYTDRDLRFLKPVGSIPVPKAEPLKQPSPAQPSQEELEAALMAAKLAEANK